MMTNLEILSEEKILTLQNNKKEVIESIKNSKDNNWLKDFFKEANPFVKSKISIPDFNLLIAKNKDDMSSCDLENAILLHKNLNLTESQSTDDRLWISLCFGLFYDYMKQRWDPSKGINLQEHWFIPHGQKRGLIFNGIARLYWFAKLTFDESLADPYEITRFCFQDVNILIQMTFRGYSNSKTTRLAFLKALKSFISDGGSYNRNILNNILKYISFLGGAYILDAFSEKELYDKIYIKLIEFYIEEYPDQKIFKL